MGYIRTHEDKTIINNWLGHNCSDIASVKNHHYASHVRTHEYHNIISCENIGALRVSITISPTSIFVLINISWNSEATKRMHHIIKRV